jgi:glycosyltransferase involved in cell wall biosynthesis
VRVGVYVGTDSPQSGGGFTIVDEIAKAVARGGSGSRHDFVLLTAGGAAAGRASYEGLEVLSLKEALTAERSVATRVKRRLSRERDRLKGRPPTSPWSPGEVPRRPAVDKVLTQARIDVVWYLSAWECCTLELPFITVVWDLQHRRQAFFPEVSVGGVWAARERMFSSVLQRAAMIVAGNEVGRDEIERFYGVPRERIRLMPHPTPALAEAPTGQNADRVVAGEYLFYPAQFWAHKNHVNLLLALRLLRERHGLDVSLALTGSDKGNQGFVEKTARELGLADHVRFLGFVSRDQMRALYRDALALTYVTFFGPENLPPLEAFAAGCPVVASDVAGAREQMGDAALLVDPREPEQIAAAVVRVRSEPGLRERLIQAGRERAQRHTAADFVSGVRRWLDEFEGVRRCWPSGVPGSGDSP